MFNAAFDRAAASLAADDVLVHGVESSLRIRSLLKISLHQLSCLALLVGFRAHASASDDYGSAFTRADTAERNGDLAAAARELESALQQYPRDYALTLRLGWLHFRQLRYTDAERSYRIASEVSEGAADALIGLAWSLIQQQRCADARPHLQRVLETVPGDARAQQGLDACATPDRVSASLWLEGGGALYHDNPWKSWSGDISIGATLAPLGPLQLGAAYRFLGLSASDSRVAGYAQHEGYVQAGYASDAVALLAHGAIISSAQGVLSASRHVGISGRVQTFGALLLELSGSFYRDLWVARLAPAWHLTFGSFSLTPGVALQRLARETLVAASLGAAFARERWSIWVSGKFGEEYRSAYLTQFAVWNSDDRIEWGVAAGLRIRVGEHWAVFVSYALNRLKSPDQLNSDLHLLSLGTALTL
jgi:tetratricopeptide (TPR) repeat protein